MSKSINIVKNCFYLFLLSCAFFKENTVLFQRNIYFSNKHIKQLTEQIYGNSNFQSYYIFITVFFGLHFDTTSIQHLSNCILKYNSNLYSIFIENRIL